MKLYRGLKTSEFLHFSDDIASELKELWSDILKCRAKGNFSFPERKSSEIIRAEKLIRLQRQHFTDQKKFALNYAKENGGALIEIDVPQGDILKYFQLEFQNFGKRKASFEIVYVVDAHLLGKFQKKWRMRSQSLSGEKNAGEVFL